MHSDCTPLTRIRSKSDKTEVEALAGIVDGVKASAAANTDDLGNLTPRFGRPELLSADLHQSVSSLEGSTSGLTAMTNTVDKLNSGTGYVKYYR